MPVSRRGFLQFARPGGEPLTGAFLAARRQSWFASLAELLLLEGFAEVGEESYTPLLQWAHAAKAACFDRPA